MQGQSRSLQGIVVDSAGKPITGAQVIASNPMRQTGTGRDGRFRLAMGSGDACVFEVLQRGFQVARLRFEPCPDTAIRITMKHADAGTPSFEELRDRCGVRSSTPCTDNEGRRFVTISAGQSHTCGITTDSLAYCWGDGRRGQLGNGQRVVARFPQRVSGNQRFSSIAAGGAFTCALTAQGHVWCWGNERTVPGWPQQADQPVEVRLSNPAMSLTAGRRHACILDSAGRASCWGWNVDGETGTGSSGITQSIVAAPTHVLTDSRFTMVSAGFGFTCGVTPDGGVLCWGSNVDGILGPTAPERCGDVASIPCSSRPVPVAFPEPIVQVSSGTTHACAIGRSGSVYCWGSNPSGQAGVTHSPTTSVSTPSVVGLPVTDPVIHVSSGGIQTCALTSTQRAYCWGADALTFGRNTGRAGHPGPALVAGGQRFSTISAGQIHVCAVDAASRLRCWGDTILGALGIR